MLFLSDFYQLTSGKSFSRRGLFLCVFALVTALSLAACGEGYEMVRTTEVTPYGNSRTAGSGVMYVQAKMLPEKELKLENEVVEVQETEEVIEIVEEPEVVIIDPEPNPVVTEEENVEKVSKELDKVFGSAQRK